MKAAARILIGLAAIALAVGAALALFVHVYLTEERIKAIILPAAKTALARDVSIDGIKVSLLSGITVNGFSVKEKNGKSDFLSADAFVLSYNLMPLLQKQFVVSEVRLESPKINIHRDRTGKFNYETLAILDKSAAKDNEEVAAKETQAVLPLALTVNRIKISNAKITVSDAKKELPAISAKSDLNIALNITKDLADITYQGDISFAAEAIYGKVKPTMSGSGTFDHNNIALKADITLDKEKAHFDGQVNNYLADPKVRLDISSPSLNFDNLIALMAGIPKAAEKAGGKKSAAKQESGAIGEEIPPGLTVRGTVSLDKTVYIKLEMTDLSLSYSLEKGVFTVKDFTADTAGGRLDSEFTVDLMQPDFEYQGQVAAKSLHAEKLRASLFPEAKDFITGALESSFSFSGAGSEWSQVSKSLTAEGSYALREAVVRNTAITSAIASILNLPEMKTLVFDDMSGSVRIDQGKAHLSTSMSGKDLSVQSKGTVGLDGKLNLPITIELSRALTEKLKQRASFAQYLAGEEGKAVIRLKLAGTVHKPQPVLDAGQTRKQIKKTIQKKLLDELEKSVSEKDGETGKAAPALDILKGILGR